MKKTIALVVLALTFSMNTQAQKKQSREKGKGKDLTIEQKTTLAVKKMTLNLDLSDDQQNQVRPLITKKITDRSKIKENRELKKSTSSIDHFQIKSERLDKMIAFKRKMKQILNAKQFEKFEKSSNRKMHQKKKHLERKAGANKRS